MPVVLLRSSRRNRRLHSYWTADAGKRVPDSDPGLQTLPGSARPVGLLRERDEEAAPCEEDKPASRLRNSVIRHLDYTPGAVIAITCKQSNETIKRSPSIPEQARDILHEDRSRA